MVTLRQIFHKNPLYKSHCIFVLGPQQGFYLQQCVEARKATTI